MGDAEEKTTDSGQKIDESTVASGAGAGGPDVEDPVVALQAAEEQIASLKDQVLRAQAEAENVRRRTAREVENAHKYGIEKFVAALLPVIDSLEKAVESAQISAQAEGAVAAQAIGQGVELSLKLLYDVLEKAGVRRIYPLGEPFNPELHEAMATVENSDVEPNSVVDVMLPGYALNDRVVRAAKVIVSKAPDA